MNEQPTIDLEKLLPWSKPNRIETRNGPRDLSKCNLPSGQPHTETFWDLWQNPEAKKQMVIAGISVSKEWGGTEWQACFWRMPPREEQVRIETSLATSGAIDAPADLVIPCPEGCAYLPYQRGGIAYALGRPGTLIADDMGLGKTIQAIGFINCRTDIKKVIVVCPASVKINWYRELQKWLTRPMSIRIAEPQYWPTSADIIIVNYDIISRFVGEIAASQIDLTIADEAHLIKNPKTQRGASVLAIGKQSKYRLALTGTPMENNEQEVFCMAAFCDPKEYDNAFMFKRKFSGTQQNRANLQRKLRSTIMVRRLKSEVLKELPAKFRSVIEVPYEDESLKAFEAEAMRKVPQKRIDELKAALELAKASDRIEDYTKAVEELAEGTSTCFEMMAELRSRTALVTLPYAIGHLKNLFDQGIPKVIFFSHHRAVNDAVHAAFPNSVQHYGGMTEANKQQAVDRFQMDPNCNLFSGSIRASGVGITLTAASRVVFGEIDWVPGRMEQAGDRAHRIGQKDNVTIDMLVLEGSFFATMAKRIVEKQTKIDQALDKDRDILTREPIFVAPVYKVKPITASRRDIEERALTIDPSTIAAVHDCLKQLAGVCDGAQARDDSGFSGADTIIGHSLANQARLSPRQAVLGQKLVRKYRRQLGSASLDVALRGTAASAVEE